MTSFSCVVFSFQTGCFFFSLVTESGYQPSSLVTLVATGGLQSADHGCPSGQKNHCLQRGAVFSHGIAGEGGAASREPALIFGAGFHPRSSWVERWERFSLQTGRKVCLSAAERPGAPALGSGLQLCALPTPWVTRPQALVLRPALAPLRLLCWGQGAEDPTPPPSARAPLRGSPLEVLVLTCPGASPASSS